MESACFVLVFDVVFHAVLVIEGVIRQGVADIVGAGQAVLVECLCQDAHHAVEVVVVGVLV